MKKLLSGATIVTFIMLSACKQQRYYDLTAGKYVDLERDDKTGLMVSKTTHEPVYIYVDKQTNDTIYGATGKIINGYVVKTGEGKYKFDEEEYKFKHGDYKEKSEGDEAKVKTGDKKIKTDEEGRKVKND